MKALLLLAILVSSPSAVFGQKPFQVLVVGYDYKDQVVYFCDDKRLNEIATTVVIVNLFSSTDPKVVVDSLRSTLDTTQFSKLFSAGPIELGQFGILSGPVYRPTRVGIDTVKLSAHFGAYHSWGQIVCYAQELKKTLLSGISRTTIEYNGNGVVLENYVLRDTLLDYFRLAPYRVSLTPQTDRNNAAIRIRSCNGAIIDSVKLESDFSEFNFHNLPTEGQAVPDSFAITYDFTPKIIGDHQRYLSFKIRGQGWLTWIFQYRVRPALSVNSRNENADELRVSRVGHTLRIESDRTLGNVDLYDIKGVRQRSVDAAGALSTELDARGLPTGLYFTRCTETGASAKVVIE